MHVPLRIRDLTALAIVCVFALAASGTHVVRSGETLGTIAKDHDSTVSAIVEANGLRDPNLIMVGQQLTIPGAGTASGQSASEPAAAPVTHVVRTGDTLGGIAARYGTTVAAIVAANGLDDPNRIRVGNALTVAGAAPDGAAGAGSAGLPGQRHQVSFGDSLATIAARYGLRAEDIARWNGIVDGQIYSTTRLLLFNPGGLPDVSATTSSTTHTVASAETLSGIAQRYGVSTSAIMAANGISDPNLIRIGQALTVPGSSGGMVCPVPGGSFFNDWGFPRSGGRAHSGNDIFAPRGTPILAPVDGLVEIATGRIGGKQFRLTAADGSTWFGSHMDDFAATGQVTAGTVIGTVGDSGNALGGRPHLHFEVHTDHAVNPYPMLRKAC